MRFRTKTILGVGLIEMVLLAVLVGIALSVLRDSNEVELTQRVQLGGKLLAAAAKDAVISQDLATLDSLVIEAMASGQIAFVRILDAGGVVLAERGNSTLLSRSFHQEYSLDKASDGIFDWSVPVLAGGIRHGEVQLGVSTDSLNVLLATAQRWAAGIAGLEMLLVALFSWLLGSYLARQLVALRNASERLATGDFAHRVAIQGNDELTQTAVAFNSMAQQLGDGRDLLESENRERIKAQQSAEDRTEQLNAIFALSPDGFVSFDAARRVKFVNPAFTSMTGIALAQINGFDETAFTDVLAELCAAEGRFRGVQVLRTSIASDKPGKREHIELALARKYILEVSLRSSEASSVSQILYFRDVTHESEVDRMKSEFLSTAAHELRTPMAAIYGFTELLLTQDHDDASRRECLSIIYKQSELMASILNELLDLARIEARRGKDFILEEVSVQALVLEVANEFNLPAGRSAPVLVAPSAPLYIMADHKKAQQAIMNVLSNAYKYSPAGGNVSITVEQASFAGEASHGQHAESSPRVAIRIVDQGIGMTAAQLDRVCERFYRADTSGKIPGTGLGMSIVKEIVELHGGEVQISSLAGTGTTVTLWLPSTGTQVGTPVQSARKQAADFPDELS
jgi:signal transduction histidine kinase